MATPRDSWPRAMNAASSRVGVPARRNSLTETRLS
nr:MAG TPA: hypothetical protein [Caudoviricetes sp.]